MLSEAQAGELLPLKFEVPEQFAEIDLAEDPEQRAERSLGQLEQNMPDTTPEQRLHMLLLQQFVIERMVGEGVVYAATLVAATDEETPRLTMGQFAVSVRDTQGVQPQTLDMIADSLRDPDVRRDVGFVQLPAGRALAVVEDRELATPTNVLGEPSDDVHLIRQLQLTLPFPDGRKLANFAISTECLYDWDSYVEILGGIAKTIRFEDGQAEDVGITPADLRSVLGGE